jgi:hypothetical protein
LFGPMVSFTSWRFWISRHTRLKPSHSTSRDRCLKRPSRQPRHIVTACGLGRHRTVYFSPPFSVCMLMTCLHTRITLNWVSTRTTLPSQPRTASWRCS